MKTSKNRDKKTDGRNIHQRQENMAKEIWKEEGGDEYFAARTSPGGETRRQIDYIATNAKYRNAARTARSNPHWCEYESKSAAPMPGDETILQ